MEALLIVNGLLLAFGVYSLKQFHQDFKQMKKSVEDLKWKFTEHKVGMEKEIQSVKRRLDKLEPKKRA